MAFAFVGTAALDTPTHKIFTVSMSETDGVATHTHLTYAAGGMGPLIGTPSLMWKQEVTTAATAPHVTADCDVRADTVTEPIGRLGIICTKYSVAHGGGTTHTYRVYVIVKSANGV